MKKTDSIEGSFIQPENKVYKEPIKKISKSQQARDFIKKLPRRKSFTERDISTKFFLTRQTTFFLLSHIQNELNLSTKLEWQDRDNGRKYQVRIYYKP